MFYIRLLIIAFSFSCCSYPSVSNKETIPPPTPIPPMVQKRSAKNVILLIGDGMGPSQISAYMYKNDNKISLERFPITGLHKCHSADNLVTDSAAGATAFSCGEKTFNGAIGMGMEKQSLPTILEYAEKQGKATGLISTCAITHATPASFIAHNESRYNSEEIASDFMNTSVDLLIGGGKNYFNARKNDKRDLLAELRTKNYKIDDFNTKEIHNLQIDASNPYIYFTADNHPLKASEGRDYLKDASMSGIEFLNKRSEEGFFIMIEGSQIDWGGHANDADYILNEMADFDKTVDAVLDWAIEDGETLVLVTADHETGGFAINGGSIGDSLLTAFTSGGHTAVVIPVFAYGPGSEKFSGLYDNTEIYTKMREAFGWMK